MSLFPFVETIHRQNMSEWVKLPSFFLTLLPLGTYPSTCRWAKLCHQYVVFDRLLCMSQKKSAWSVFWPPILGHPLSMAARTSKLSHILLSHRWWGPAPVMSRS